MKNSESITAQSSLVVLSKKWSWRARRLISMLAGNPTILDLYWLHWSGLGKNKYRGFDFATNGVGLGTYEEIRRYLLKSGFPDLSHGMFSPSGFCTRCCPKVLLEKVLPAWKHASRQERAVLSREIEECWCDGH